MAQDTLLGFPAHTLPYRRGEFTTLLTVSHPARITVPGVLHFAKCWWLKIWSEQKQW